MTSMKYFSRIFLTLIISGTLLLIIRCRGYSKITAQEMHQPVILGPIARVGSKLPEKRSIHVQNFKFSVRYVDEKDNVRENEEGILVREGGGPDVSQNIRRIYYNETLKIFVDRIQAKSRAICHVFACIPSETTSVIGGIYE